MGKSSPSAPPAPDYKGAAEAQTASQRVSQYTPYGSQVYSPTGTDPQGNLMWRSDINLEPQAQQALDSQLGLSASMGQLAQSQVPGVQEQYSKPMDLSSVPQIADKAYGAMTSRLDPQWQQREQMLNTQLVNQGLRPGMEAYSNAMRDFNTGRNDAYQQANLAAIQTMPQTYQLASSTYNQPLNTLNAIRSGAQVQNPQFGPQQGTNYLGAAQSAGQYGQGLYNADVGQYNAMTQGLYGLGATGAGLGTLLLLGSDRRMKRNIERIGTYHGLPWYRFEYIWGEKSEGVMADEVEKVNPAAVFTRADGYKFVNYAAL